MGQTPEGEKEGLSFILSYTNGLQDSINYSELSGP